MSSTVPSTSSSSSTVSALVKSGRNHEELRRAVLQDPYLPGLVVRDRWVAALLLEEMTAEELSAVNGVEFGKGKGEGDRDHECNSHRTASSKLMTVDIQIQEKQEQLRRVLESGWSTWMLHRRSSGAASDDVVVIKVDASDLHLHGPEEDLLPLLVILFWPCNTSSTYCTDRKDQHAVPPSSSCSSSSGQPPAPRLQVLTRPRVEVNCACVDWRRPTWRSPDQIGRRRPEVDVVEDGALSCLPALLPVSSLVLDYTQAFVTRQAAQSSSIENVTSAHVQRQRPSPCWKTRGLSRVREGRTHSE